jgi:hypothetical protein
MPNLRTDFTQGKMNLDADTRLLPAGEFRKAININVANSESSDVGSIQKSYSNKRLTNIDYGTNPKCLLGLEDELRDRIYWFIKSDDGCFLMEWNNRTEVISFVLKDTRPISTRVLNLDENFLITGIEIILAEDTKEDLLLWTDGNMEPCSINIARAKLYGENNFDKEDIYLIKKPPLVIPVVTPINIGGLTNNLQERFLAIGYRYKYLDKEYSAISTYSNYNFNPNLFKLNYFTLENEGMVNAFNAMRIEFNTGERQVTDIQLIVKESNSSNLYVIETFNKKDENWLNNQIQSFTFSNDKTYKVLPEKELFRTFDNVPWKAKALTIIGNIPVFGNYTEGRDLIDIYDREVFVDYTLELISNQLDQESNFINNFPLPNQMVITNANTIPLNKDNKILIYLNINIGSENAYDKVFSYILPQNYNTLLDVFATTEFSDFVVIIDADLKANYFFTIPPGYVETTPPSFQYTSELGTTNKFILTPAGFTHETTNSVNVYNLTYNASSYIAITTINNATSLKSNRDVEVGIVYEEDFGRKTTVLTSKTNSIYIPQKFSSYQNKIKVSLNHNPPKWAKRYRFVFKTQPLNFQTIFVNKYYNEDFFVWAKLEAENKDKVKTGDILIVKKGPNLINEPIRVKVLDVKEQEKDFIKLNNDENGNPIIEEAGYYMKIRPEGFAMSYDQYDIYQKEFKDIGSIGFPRGYLDLSTEIVAGLPVEIKIPSGSSIQLIMNSSFKFKAGWENNLYDVLHYAQTDYNSIEDWFNDNIINKNLFTQEVNGIVKNYKPNVELVRGFFTQPLNFFTPSSLGKLYFKVKGLIDGGSGGRQGYIRAKIIIRTSDGFYVFETEPKIAENDIFFENAQTFDIVNNKHTGNIQNQDLLNTLPAICELDFFNCYSQGNGVESYRVKDGFNTRYLNIDLKPSATLNEKYREITRKADLTYGEAYVESTNVNGINAFNASTNNFKELDKQFGSIQKLLSRDTDIVVLQEDKASKVLFNKSVLYNADGTLNISAANTILGTVVTYLGENGIGTAPESCAVNAYQIYYANPRKGLVQRLSIDGVEPIINGMNDYFRDKFIQNKKVDLIAGYDPFHEQYILSFGKETDIPVIENCGATIIKENTSIPYNYQLKLNNLLGDTVLNYNIKDGSATIEANNGRISTVESNVAGVGSMVISRSDLKFNIVDVTITPVSSTISFEIVNDCPVGKQGKIVLIVLNDETDQNKSITNRIKWGNNIINSYNDVLGQGQISKFLQLQGVEGQGNIPDRFSVINMQAFTDTLNDLNFNVENCNRLGYLISNAIYTSADLTTLLSNVNYLTVSGAGNLHQGNFLYNKTADDQILYLLWDYRDNMPVANSDIVLIEDKSNVKVITVLQNDIYSGVPNLAIESNPLNGNVVINLDGTITYTRTDALQLEDEFTYSITNGLCKSIAKVYITYSEGDLEFLPVYTAVTVHRNTTQGLACALSAGNQFTKYIDTPNFSSAVLFFNDINGFVNAPEGWYSNGSIARHWTGTTFDNFINC